MASLQLNNALQTYEERLEWVNKEMKRIGEDKLTPYQRDKIATYLIDGTNPESRGEIITANRLVTVNKRDTINEFIFFLLLGSSKFSRFHHFIIGIR